MAAAARRASAVVCQSCSLPRLDGSRGGQARFQIALLLRPIGFGLLYGGCRCRQIHCLDRFVIALHILDFLGQVLLQVDPVGRVFANAFGVGHGRGAHLLLPRQQGFGTGTIGTPVLFFELFELGRVWPAAESEAEARLSRSGYSRAEGRARKSSASLARSRETSACADWS